MTYKIENIFSTGPSEIWAYIYMKYQRPTTLLNCILSSLLSVFLNMSFL